VRNGFRVGEAYHVEPSLNSVTARAGTVHLDPKVMNTHWFALPSMPAR
jgi:hypothetical protein